MPSPSRSATSLAESPLSGDLLGAFSAEIAALRAIREDWQRQVASLWPAPPSPAAPLSLSLTESDIDPLILTPPRS